MTTTITNGGPETTELVVQTTALEKQQGAGIVCVAGDITEALTQYIAVKDALDLALPDCIMTISGKSFRKKNFWRAVATAFNLDVQCMTENEHVERGDDWGFELTYRAIAPNGRFADGDGSCFASEKEKGRMAATVHNVRAHAHTRAFNRAVSNLVGFGEVSAEEINLNDGVAPDSALSTVPAPRQQTRAPAPRQQEPPAASTQGPPCPNCGGPMWDNRQTKTGRQPDFKCKDRAKGCNPGAIWLDSYAPAPDHAGPPRKEDTAALQAALQGGEEQGFPAGFPGEYSEELF